MFKKTTLEYVWIDDSGMFRSAYKTTTSHLIDDWNYDGCSTNQTESHHNEITLKPVAIYHNPFLECARLVLCNTYYTHNNEPTLSNTRVATCDKLKGIELDPMFGFKQDYYMLYSPDNPDNHAFKPEGNYYCGVGTSNIYLRQLAEKHLEVCLQTGLNITSMNAEVGPNQWSYQIGSGRGIDAADHLIMSRYILIRLAEEYGIYINFNSKPLTHNNDSKLHVYFSTSETRKTDGLDYIYKYVHSLQKHHSDFMNIHGTEHPFSYGIGYKDVSINIPMNVYQKKQGYLEDHRAKSNSDPYLIIYYYIYELFMS
jgi:glutamine synthetase